MLFGEFAKSQTEAEYPELWRGLVGAWSPCLSPRGGTVLRDLSGLGRHATLTNMEPETDWKSSEGKTAIDLDGAEYVMTSTSVPSIKMVSGWFYPTSTTGYRRLWQWSSNGCSAYLDVNTYNLVVTFSGSSYNTGAALTANSWTHVCCAYIPGASSTFSVLLNGKQVSSHSPADNSFNSAFEIGWSSGAAGQYWIGLFDDVLAYNQGSRTAAMIHRLGRGGWATPRRRRWNYATAQTAIPYWVFARKNARLIGGGVS